MEKIKSDLKIIAFLAKAGLILTFTVLYSPFTLGASLNIIPRTAPDIASGIIDTYYSNSTQILTASGFAFDLSYAAKPTTTTIDDGKFELIANIDNLGNLLSGSIRLEGTISSLGYNSGTLLTGTLLDFGYGSSIDPLEFLFSVTGGDVSTLYQQTAGVILSNSGFNGNFSEDFGNKTGVSDIVAPVPTPAAVWLFITE